MVLIFDADIAGQAAAERALQTFLSHKMHVRVTAVPAGKDPDFGRNQHLDEPLEEGDAVREGDLLLVIDPARFEASVQRAEAGLAESAARETQARGNYQQSQRDW